MTTFQKEPWRKGIQGKSLEQQKHLWIRERGAELITDETEKPQYTVIHQCGILSYVDYDPDKHPELFHCECESKVPDGKIRVVCPVGHFWYSHKTGVSFTEKCKECERIQNSLTKKEQELTREARLSKLDIDKDQIHNPDRHRSEEFIQQRNQMEFYANIEAEKLALILKPILQELSDAIKEIKHDK